MIVDVHKTQESCGMGVPKYDFVEERRSLLTHWEKKGEAFMHDYWDRRNSTSQDGLEPYPLSPPSKDEN